jgi:hypothetical protein
MLPGQPETRKYAQPHTACSAVLGEDAGAAGLGLQVPKESPIEGYKHQDNTDVRYQPSRGLIPKEQQIYTNNNGYQHHNVKRQKHVSFHFAHRFKDINSRLPTDLPDLRQHPLIEHDDEHPFVCISSSGV